jgi:hypothetical protein
MFARLDRRGGGATGVVGSYTIRLGEDLIEMLLSREIISIKSSPNLIV